MLLLSPKGFNVHNRGCNPRDEKIIDTSLQGLNRILYEEAYDYESNNSEINQPLLFVNLLKYIFMSRTKIVTGFSRYRDPELDQKAKFIIDSMTGNPHFTSPVPTIEEITTANDEYITARSNAETGDRESVAIKNQKREALENLLNKLALYVEASSNDDEAIMLSSGFSISKHHEPVGILPKPQNFSARPTQKSMISLKLQHIPGAGSYQFEYRQTGVTEWTIEVHTKSNMLLTGLESGKEYEFRVTGIGAAPERVYSDVLRSYVL